MIRKSFQRAEIAMKTTKGTAVVTGVANGIGQAYARRLASDGFDIAVADVGDAAATRALVEAEGRRFFSSIVDVTSPAETLQFAAQVEQALGPVSALVNNTVKGGRGINCFCRDMS